MAAADAEVTIICIDNSTNTAYNRRIRNAQFEAIRLYCKTNLKCNRENTVGLMSMATSQHGLMLPPTRNLPDILSCLQKVIRYSGEAEFSRAIYGACSFLSKSLPHMKRRVLMFVGGLINLQMGDDKLHGANLKRLGAALDVVNFFIVNLDYKAFAHSSILTDKYRYARKELGALVTAANNNDNSHIVDVADVTSVVKILSDSSILKNNLHYLEKKAAADAEHVKASRIQFDKPELKNKSAANDEYVQAKKTPHIDYKIREDLSRCRICKQGLELSHDDSNRFLLLRNLDNISRDRFEAWRE